jgi:hypothetical protein
MAAPADIKYGQHQVEGRRLKEWLEDPTAPNCPVEPLTLKMRHLGMLEIFRPVPYNRVHSDTNPSYFYGCERVFEKHQIPKQHAEVPAHGRVPASGYRWHRVAITDRDAESTAKDLPQAAEATDPEDTDRFVYCDVSVASSAMIIRYLEGIDPIPSHANHLLRAGVESEELALSVYTHYNHKPNMLRNIIWRYVGDDDINRFAETQLYTEANKLNWPDNKVRVWRYGTPEYEALLGTETGKVTARLLLGAVERGTRRISHIETWYNMDALCVHFLIEEIIDTSDPMGLGSTDDESDLNYTGPMTRSRMRLRQEAIERISKRKIEELYNSDYSDDTEEENEDEEGPANKRLRAE